jgi:ABC-type xylose transport system permease subunit
MKNARILGVLAGDFITLALVTLAGFATHNELGSAGFRMLTTFIPLLVAWLLLAPHLRVYDPRCYNNPAQLWRPFWAMVLAAPLAGWVRGFWLNTPIIPIFVVVLGGISSLAILAWRSMYWLAFARGR